MFRVMLYFVDLYLRSEEIYGDSWMKYWPLAMYSLLPILAPMIFDPIAEMLNKFENHPTSVIMLSILLFYLYLIILFF